MPGRKKILVFTLTGLFLLLLLLYSLCSGSIPLGPGQLLRGLFLAYDETVAAVQDLRFPRILIALLAGAALGTAGCLLQSVLHNPLADPGIIGVSGGASFVYTIVAFFLPQLFFFLPFFAFLGGALGFFLVYILAAREGHKPVHLLLIGVAINALFLGLVQALTYMTGQIMGAMPGLTLVNIGMKGWSDVQLLLCYVPLGLLVAFCCHHLCDLMMLEEQTVESLGLRVGRIRIGISLLAVFLASMVTSVVGVISFLALLVPHAARRLVGQTHRVLLPYSALLGALVFLLCDSFGRIVFSPVEIPASIVMTVVGGPLFVLLLRKGRRLGHA